MNPKNEPAGLGLRLVAAKRLKAVLAGDNFKPLTTDDLVDGRDRALANHLLTMTLRRQGQLNFIIHALLDKGMPNRSGSFEAVLRLSLTQLVFLPDLGVHSAVFLAVEAVRRDRKAHHLAGLMNAVLRKAQADSARFRSLNVDLLIPDTFGSIWRDTYGKKAVADFSTALLCGAPLDITLKTQDTDLVAALGAQPVFADTIRIRQRDRPVEAMPGYAEGKWWIQDAASAIPARLLKTRESGHVLDLCAAPGGKTAQLIKAGYRVTALDNDPARIDRLRANLSRLGYAAKIIVGDACNYIPDTKVDGVLLDAPCSATGIFRRHPEVIWHRSAKDVSDRAQLQQAMLVNACGCLDTAGVLIYCVCSLEPLEGEAQVDWALDALPDLQLWPVQPDELAGLEQAVTRKGLVRIHPGMTPGKCEGGVDGFFVARFRRR